MERAMMRRDTLRDPETKGDVGTKRRRDDESRGGQMREEERGEVKQGRG